MESSACLPSRRPAGSLSPSSPRKLKLPRCRATRSPRITSTRSSAWKRSPPSSSPWPSESPSRTDADERATRSRASVVGDVGYGRLFAGKRLAHQAGDDAGGRWLDQELIEASGERLLAVRGIAGDGDQQYLGAKTLPEALCRLVSVHARHPDIDEYDFGWHGGGGPQRFGAAIDDPHVVTCLTQEHPEGIGAVGVVVHHQDAA